MSRHAMHALVILAVSEVGVAARKKPHLVRCDHFFCFLFKACPGIVVCAQSFLLPSTLISSHVRKPDVCAPRNGSGVGT